MPDPTLPFFAYGIFSPGQIAFCQIKSFVRQITNATIIGRLLIRDGVPVLDAAAEDGLIVGHRIEFHAADTRLAYDVIERMEPPTQYRWSVSGEMNILVGLKPQRGSHPIETDSWGWGDPSFHDALRVVDEALLEQTNWDDLRSFYRLQGAYMVLWSSIERYLSLRYHLGRNDKVVEQVNRLADERQFGVSLRDTDPAATQKLRRLFRADDPTKAVRFDPCGSPKKAVEYLYQVRSNVTHRGKAQRLDWTLLHTATEEALRIFRDVLRTAEEASKWRDTSAG